MARRASGTNPGVVRNDPALDHMLQTYMENDEAWDEPWEEPTQTETPIPTAILLNPTGSLPLRCLGEGRGKWIGPEEK